MYIHNAHLITRNFREGKRQANGNMAVPKSKPVCG
jgi:hypothetical protein